ncbi:hypothetical protein DVDV_3386 [Desulfovibrio sp. DV]|nr:hypothetical protein DVDV_3386 [Desulfovibrio sp. DV]
MIEWLLHPALAVAFVLPSWQEITAYLAVYSSVIPNCKLFQGIVS